VGKRLDRDGHGIVWFNMRNPRTPRKQPKISVLLSAPEAVRFDSYCNERGHKKSTLIARLIREHLEREHFHPPELFHDSAEARRKP
jgi:hypothetical protein